MNTLSQSGGSTPVASVPPKRVVAFCIEALTVGGAEQMLVAMANAFVSRGWQVHMVCLTSRGELADDLSDGIAVHVLDKKSGVDISLPGKLRSLLKKLAPDVVNSHLWTANLWTRIAMIYSGVPVVATEHSRDFWKPAHYRWLDRQLCHATAKLVAVSEDTADFYRNDIGLPEKLIQVINNGVNTARYAAGDGTALRSLWVDNTDVLIGTVGRMVPAKNHPRLMQVAAELKARGLGFHIVVVGDGPELEAVKTSINENQVGDAVTLAGARSDIPDVLAAFDIFVLSSDREGHPLTALEAQAAGTPVVLTKAGGSSDALADDGKQQGGFLVECDTSALVDALEKLISDPSMRQQMADFAQLYALQYFDMVQMVDKYQVVFEQCSVAHKRQC